MNSQVIEGRWTRLRGALQKRWGRLTGDDLEEIEGRRKTLEGKLRERYGYSKHEAREQVDDFLDDAGEQLGDLRERWERRMREGSEEIQHRVEEAREQMRDKADYYESKLKDMEASDVADTMKSNPLMLAAAAVLLAVFIGLWMKSMNR